MATIQIRIDDATKAAADNLFSSLGLDTSTAVRMFLKASLEQEGFPFTIKRQPPDLMPKAGPRSAMFGCLRGQYTLTDDFDAPLDDFKDYMA